MVGFGLLIAGVGAALILLAKIPHFGRLPGDIHVERPAFSFYFPITTSIILSILASLIVAFLRRK